MTEVPFLDTSSHSNQLEPAYLHMKSIICSILISSFYVAAESQGYAANLEDCYRGALARSEDVATQGELLNQAEEKYKQAIGSVLPQISGTAQELWQDNSSQSPLFPSNQPLVKLTATQALFQGFREFAALRQSKSNIRAQEEAKRQAATQLYKDVSTSFYTVIASERDILNLQSEIGFYDRRIADLKQFYKIGRSRLSEVLTSQSLVAGLKAQIEQATGQRNVNRQILAYLTGLSPDVPLTDAETLPASIASLESYLAKLEARPDVAQNLFLQNSAHEGISIAKGAHLPNVNFLGDYYLVRFGSLSNVAWDVQLALTLPIFSGGVIQSQVRSAESIFNQADLSLSKVKRLGEEEIRTLYAAVQADQRQYAALVEAEQLSEKTFNEQTREYKLGLVTNLDVIQAMTVFQENKRSLDRASSAMKLDYAKLEAAAAMRPAVH